MALVNLTTDAFEKFITQNDMIIFDFWAEWCGPCKQFGPVFEAAAEQHPNIMFAKVNVEEEPELANRFQVRSIPTLAFMREKVMVYANPGALPASNFEQGIQEMLNLDMKKVHADVAAMQQQQG